MLSEKVFAVFSPGESRLSLAELSLSLLRQQQRTWPQLIEGYEALTLVRLREVQCNGYSVFLQFNPRRIVSTGAKVDPGSIAQRKCFLCLENLPAEQRGVLYGDTFLVLCNPAPILDKHMTISSVRHIPQAMEGNADTFLSLAEELGPAFTVLYNGPKCGASAPDHLHFQAGPAGSIPIEKEASLHSRRLLQKTVAGVNVFTLKNIGRQVVMLEGSHAGSVRNAFLSVMSAMMRIAGTTEEPMVNLLCSFSAGVWRVIVFPRKKHRPAVYFNDGDAQVLISPASVDIGGLVVTPVEKDFLSVDASMIEGIFSEVSADEQLVNAILNELS